MQEPLKRYNPLAPVSTLEEKREQALEQCDYLIRDFAKRADRYKARYKRLQVMSVTLAICTTILSALSASGLFGLLEWVVPAISGLATLATTLLSQTNTQRLWVESRNIAQQFQMEMFLYLQSSGRYLNVQDESEGLKVFSKQLMDVWSQAQETWSQQASSNT
ncbi:DUF4231 domain-containing protein [Oscillatoria sp. CS-180]|uniref:DUF4231 domain-containing protein n=1 Tax=Oscillatoria sp. CS-180 TaxID=3021720 RepID=UPI00232FC11F|nr:DUF4231 domain-containing protein [Oscillatoria sp. CS-180]MDB9525273.1 DUF4231 domain-containing protein [Oscillatoria sp. CS-180]